MKPHNQRKSVLVYLLAIGTLVTSTLNSSSTMGATNGSQVLESFRALPLSFTSNDGQWDRAVLYSAKTFGSTMWFGNNHVYYQFTRMGDCRYTGGAYASQSNEDRQLDRFLTQEGSGFTFRQHDQPEGTQLITVSFPGATGPSEVSGGDATDYRCNYLLGDDPSRWCIGVSNYSDIAYRNLYEGIDLKYYGDGSSMKYDFIVAPGADLSQISVQYEGVDALSITGDGRLVVRTRWANIVEEIPAVYQIGEDGRIPREGRYVLHTYNSFGFAVDNYDPTLPLVVDPVLSYSTYLGGSGLDGVDEAFSIAVDASGSAYIAGVTTSTAFPMVNPAMGTFSGGGSDAFVTKFSPAGSSLVYSTYLGGNGQETGGYWWREISIALDASNAAYIAGVTTSTNFPTYPVSNPFQGTYGGNTDAFVVKLDPQGLLFYSTYLGGSGVDRSAAIAVDASGSAYITGLTTSTNFPVQNALYGTIRGAIGGDDAFVTKFNSAGTGLAYSTYLGGQYADQAFGLAVNSSTGVATVVGTTNSLNFPVLSYYQLKQGDAFVFNAFVTRLSAAGNSLVYSTYLGGSSDNSTAHSVAVDASGFAYVTGYTDATNFPVNFAFQSTKHAGTDAFVTKLAVPGNALQYSTYLGGNNEDFATSIAIDAAGTASIAGITRSTDFPVLKAIRTTHQGGWYDGFVTQLASSGSSLIHSTYLGGNSDDYGFGIALGQNGATYITGKTNSTNFPVWSAYDATRGTNGDDAFVTKIVPCPVLITGDVNGSGSVTSADIDYLVNYVFKAMAPPVPCPAAGDVDCSGSVIGSDVVYLVNYVFKSGPMPCDVCTLIPTTWSCP